MKNTETVAALMSRKVAFEFPMPGRDVFFVRYTPADGFRTVYNDGTVHRSTPGFIADRFVPETVCFIGEVTR